MIKCSDCIEGTSAAACTACRKMQGEGLWEWELDNGQRRIICPECGYASLIGIYVYENPRNFCAGCGKRMKTHEQMVLEV